MAARAARPQPQRTVPRARTCRSACCTPSRCGAGCAPSSAAGPSSQSDDAVLLFEPGRYPVAYFPIARLRRRRAAADRPPQRAPGARRDRLVRGRRRHAPRRPRRLAARRAPRARVDPRRTRSRSRGGRWTPSTRRTTASSATPPIRTTASTSAAPPATSSSAPATASSRTPRRPLVLYESGFAPRWYVPRDDVDADALTRRTCRRSARTRASPPTTTSADGAAAAPPGRYRAPLDEHRVEDRRRSSSARQLSIIGRDDRVAGRAVRRD